MPVINMDADIHNERKNENAILSIADLSSPGQATVFNVKDRLDKSAILACLRDRGFCIIRGLFAENILEDVVSRARWYLPRPSIAGAPGY